MGGTATCGHWEEAGKPLFSLIVLFPGSKTSLFFPVRECIFHLFPLVFCSLCDDLLDTLPHTISLALQLGDLSMAFSFTLLMHEFYTQATRASQDCAGGASKLEGGGLLVVLCLWFLHADLIPSVIVFVCERHLKINPDLLKIWHFTPTSWELTHA